MENKKCSGILVYIENHYEKIHASSLELLSEAYRLAEVNKEEVYAVAVGRHMSQIREQLRGFHVKQAWLYETDIFFQADIFELPVAECIREIRPSTVLIGGTYEGRSLAPRLAVTFETGLTADCTELQINETGELVQIRPAFGGNIMASILTEHTRPQIATVRAGIFEILEQDDGYRTEFIFRDMPQEKKGMEIIDVSQAEQINAIAEQDLLIVAGRGVRKKEDLKMLSELSGFLGGKLASSRALVEKGWMPSETQIGLSGLTVAPKYMITAGVSGTVQFMAGMKHAKNIIAINSDPEARIFEIAHYPICGDLYEIIPKLRCRLQGGKRIC